MTSVCRWADVHHHPCPFWGPVRVRCEIVSKHRPSWRTYKVIPVSGASKGGAFCSVKVIIHSNDKVPELIINFQFQVFHDVSIDSKFLHPYGITIRNYFDTQVTLYFSPIQHVYKKETFFDFLTFRQIICASGFFSIWCYLGL